MRYAPVINIVDADLQFSAAYILSTEMHYA